MFLPFHCPSFSKLLFLPSHEFSPFGYRRLLPPPFGIGFPRFPTFVLIIPGKGLSWGPAPHILSAPSGPSPKGACACIPSADLASGFTREALLDPSLLLRPSTEWPDTFPSAKVHAEPAEWLSIVRHLFDIGMASFLP